MDNCRIYGNASLYLCMEVLAVFSHMRLKALGKIPDPAPAKNGIRIWPSALRVFGLVIGRCYFLL
jgi:hypothetical protein